MTKKEVCENTPAVAYWSGLGGFEIHQIEYGIDDYIIAVSNAWGGKKSFHRLKVNYSGEVPFVRCHGYKIPLDECLRV